MAHRRLDDLAPDGLAHGVAALAHAQAAAPIALVASADELEHAAVEGAALCPEVGPLGRERAVAGRRRPAGDLCLEPERPREQPCKAAEGPDRRLALGVRQSEDAVDKDGRERDDVKGLPDPVGLAERARAGEAVDPEHEEALEQQARVGLVLCRRGRRVGERDLVDAGLEDGIGRRQLGRRAGGGRELRVGRRRWRLPLRAERGEVLRDEGRESDGRGLMGGARCPRCCCF